MKDEASKSKDERAKKSLKHAYSFFFCSKCNERELTSTTIVVVIVVAVKLRIK